MSATVLRRGSVVGVVAAATHVERETQTFGGQPFVGDWLLYDKAEPTDRRLVGVVSAADFTLIEISVGPEGADVPVEVPDVTQQPGIWTSPPFAPTINPSPPYRYGDPAPTIGVSGTIGTTTTHNLPEPVISGPLYAGLGDDHPDA